MPIYGRAGLPKAALALWASSGGVVVVCPTLGWGLDIRASSYHSLTFDYVITYPRLSDNQIYSHGLRFALQSLQEVSSIKDDFFVNSSIVITL